MNITVNVDSSVMKKIKPSFVKTFAGRYDGSSDKGVYFKFQTMKDAEQFNQAVQLRFPGCSNIDVY